MKASIIIPVYNKEQYVEKCLRSALNQTFDDFEVIAVDDESTDQSGAICDRMAQEDPRLRVFHITNRRVSTSARSAGTAGRALNLRNSIVLPLPPGIGLF